MELSTSKAFFEISCGNELIQYNSLRERWLCLKDFFKKTLLLPFALLFKVYKTFFRAAGLFFAALFMAATLGTSSFTRQLFIHRASTLAADLADWILYPLALAVCFGKLLLALVIHPDIYFNR